MNDIFKNIWGNPKPLSVLASNLASDRTASAYLFSGPESVGKMTSAVLFAKAILCDTPGTDDCRCPSCTLVASGSHPDLMAIAPNTISGTDSAHKEIVRDTALLIGDTPGKEIKVGQVRELIGALSLKSYRGGWKVCILKDAEKMNPATANAFLKTLEEPPARTVIILVSSNPSRLLPTVISRCRVIRFSPLQPEELANRLATERGMTGEEALRTAQLAEGRPGAAMGSMERMRKLDEEAMQLAERLPDILPEEVVVLAERWKTRRDDIPVFFKRLMELLRIAARGEGVPSATIGGTQTVLGGLPAGRLVDGYFALMGVLPLLAYNPNVPLLMETTIFNVQSILVKGEPLA